METLIGLLVAAPLLGAAHTAVRRPAARPRRPLAGHAARAGVLRPRRRCSSSTCSARHADARTLHQHLFTWVPVGGFQADVGFQLDQLSMTFVLLITGVGTLIHIYSIGYMEHDERRRRFFG